MNIILVFTNAPRWSELKSQFDVDETLWNAQYNTIAEKLVLKYNIDNGTAVLENLPELSINEEGIYFVYDQIDGPRLSHLLEQCVNGEVFALVHTSGVQKSNFGQDVFAFRGNHDTEPDHYYYPIFDLLTSVSAGDSAVSKIDFIIKSIFMPFEEASTELLEDCLNPQRDLDALDSYNKLLLLEKSSVYGPLYRNKKIVNHLEEFRRKYESCNSFDLYDDEYFKLREVLFNCCG